MLVLAFLFTVNGLQTEIMRPKFVIVLLLLAALILGAALYFKPHPEPVTTPPAIPEIATPAPSAAANPVTMIDPLPAPVALNALTPDQRQAAVDAETDRLQAWGMSEDPAALTNILADLTHSEKEVREAAIEAAKQFGSSNAIPTLKAVAASTADTDEQIDLLEAASFLALPSMNLGGPDTRTPEQIQADQQSNADKAARRQAQKQRHAANRNSTPTTDQGAAPAAGQNPMPNPNH